MAVEIRSAKAAATRDQILDAAARLIHLRGYHGTSLDDVLRESGVGKGNFYYYFRSKEDLGFAIIDRVVERFLERTLEPAFVDLTADPLDQVRAFLDRLLEAQRQRNCVGGCPMGNLASELSDPAGRFAFTLPSPEVFAAAATALGIADSSHVVVYSNTGMAWVDSSVSSRMSGSVSRCSAASMSVAAS